VAHFEHAKALQQAVKYRVECAPVRRPRGLITAVVLAWGVGLAAGAADPTLDLLTAARHGDVAAIRQALGAGARVDAGDPDFGQTALIRAAMFNQRAAVEALLAAKANPNTASNLNRTALHWAAAAGAADVVPLLVKAGATLDAPDAYDETPLDCAAAEGQPGAVRALLAAGARVEKMHKPLAARLALVVGNSITGPPLDALIAIIESRQGLEITDSAQRTPLLVVADRAYQDVNGQVVAALVKAGANRQAKDQDGQTSMQLVDDNLARMKGAAEQKNLLAAKAALR
jgi:ankyrin repeat protein